VLHVFGSGHSGIVAREVVHRAGGLVPVSQIADPTAGWAEVLPGYGEKLFSRYAAVSGVRAGEVAVVISNSGINPSPVEVALACRAAGLRVVAVTSLGQSKAATARNPLGKKLYECADWVLDNCGITGDAALPLPGHDLKTGPTSTFTGALLLNLLVLEAIQQMTDAGQPVPILQSANTPGGRERNIELSKSYHGRLCRTL
jgi:uncharacterized phosphosugar-binding protein